MELLTREGRRKYAATPAAAITGQANNIAGTRSSDRSNGELASFASFIAGEDGAEHDEPVVPSVVDCSADEQEARF